jgi:hypothetical protein
VPTSPCPSHQGMVLSAEYIKKKLEQEMVLSQAFGRDLVRHFPCYSALGWRGEWWLPLCPKARPLTLPAPLCPLELISCTSASRGPASLTPSYQTPTLCQPQRRAICPKKILHRTQI